MTAGQVLHFVQDDKVHTLSEEFGPLQSKRDLEATATIFCGAMALHMNSSSSSPIRLLPAHDGQERQFEQAFGILEEGIRQRAFPGGVAAIAQEGRLLGLKAFGRFTYDAGSPAVQPETIYDLASVTKVVATTTVAMVLYERGVLRLEKPLVEIVPEFDFSDDPRRRQVTLAMLLSHSSGLPAYARLFEEVDGPDSLLRAACRLPLEAAPGTRAVYSDIGFILVGEALQRLTGEPLDDLCRRLVLEPLGMTHAGFCPPAELRREIPPTEQDMTFRHRVVQGEVQDENAAVLGGVAAHAGLFAPALEVAVFAESMLRGGAPLLRPETVDLFTRRVGRPEGSSRALGWDTPSIPSQSGRYFSARAFGHLGYAGTSLWIDPERQLSVTLLTNRTWPDRKPQGIKQVRPAFHDAVIAAL